MQSHTWPGNHSPWRHWWAQQQFTRASTSLYWAWLQVQRVPQRVPCCTARGGCRTTCPPSLAFSSQCSKSFSCKQPLWIQVGFVRKRYNSFTDQKRRKLSAQTGSVQHGVGPLQGLPDTTQMWGSRQVKGCKIYSLSLFLFLFYLIKTAILLGRLLLGLSYWDVFLPPPLAEQPQPHYRLTRTSNPWGILYTQQRTALQNWHKCFYFNTFSLCLYLIDQGSNYFLQKEINLVSYIFLTFFYCGQCNTDGQCCL